PYTPAQQPGGVTLAADVRAEGDRLRVELDTNGYRLEDAHILKADGTVLRPETIEHPGYAAPSSGLGLGLGIGGGSRRGLGVGVGVGTTLGTGDARSSGNTFAWFPMAEAGPPPWRLVVKVAGLDPVLIVLDPSRPPT
ncbi:MAG: hypothetical protein ACREMB_02450, partial [Candidatus Rokuibacteriota bacterium]